MPFYSALDIIVFMIIFYMSTIWKNKITSQFLNHRFSNQTWMMGALI